VSSAAARGHRRSIVSSTLFMFSRLSRPPFFAAHFANEARGPRN